MKPTSHNKKVSKKDAKKKIKQKLKIIKKARGRGIKIPRAQVVPDKKKKKIEEERQKDSGDDYGCWLRSLGRCGYGNY